MVTALARSLATLALLIAGCDQAETTIVPHSPPDLELVSAGNEPRQILRYNAEAGTREQLEVTVAVELTANEMGSSMPTLILHLTTEVDAEMPTGQRLLRTTINEVIARTEPGSTVTAKAVAGPLQVLRGLAIRSVLSPNGRLNGAHLERANRAISPDLDQQIDSLVASFESTMMTLPDEPVGVGAVWRNSRPVEQNGLRLKAVNSVSLTAVRGDVIEYTIDTDIHGDDQSVAQGETTISVKDLVGNGGGKGTIDLAHLAITSELAAEFRAEMFAEGDAKPTKMEMATLMRVQPVGSAQGAHKAP